MYFKGTVHMVQIVKKPPSHHLPKTNSLKPSKTCQCNTHGLANQIKDGESHKQMRPNRMQRFIKLRAGGMGAAGH